MCSVIAELGAVPENKENLPSRPFVQSLTPVTPLARGVATLLVPILAVASPARIILLRVVDAILADRASYGRSVSPLPAAVLAPD
jgi:hypothetical protein